MYIYVISTAQRYKGHAYMEFDGKYADYERFVTTDKKHIETFDEDSNYTKAYGELFGGTGRNGGEAAFKYKIEQIYFS